MSENNNDRNWLRRSVPYASIGAGVAVIALFISVGQLFADAGAAATAANSAGIGGSISNINSTGGNAAMNNMSPFGVVSKIIRVF